jgi:hypothetical protein
MINHKTIIELEQAASAFEYSYHSELELFSELIEHFEVYFFEQATDYKKRMAKEVLKAPSFKRRELFENLEEDLISLSESMPIITRQSIFISLIAFFENYLNSTCGMLKKYKETKLALSDISGSGIFRAKNYIEKVIGVDFPSKEPVWENITIYIKLRNIMVHADGEITNNTKKEVINFLKVHQFYFAINPMNKIEIESGFIQLVVKDMERFTSKLTRRIEKQIT